MNSTAPLSSSQASIAPAHPLGHSHHHHHAPASAVVAASSGGSAKVSPSLLRMSVVERLVVAVLLSAAVWGGVFWALSPIGQG